MTNLFLSICIPTKSRLDILKRTLDSIYFNCEANTNEFEVIVSDNSNDDLLIEMLFSYKHYPNIVYTKTTSVGFLNSINALKMGKGLFLKLHNDYTIFKAGTLAKMINLIKDEAALKPLIFFSNGELKKNNLIRLGSFDSFSYRLSFWSTWSTGFSIWKEDFDQCSTIDIDHVFPHTSLLLSLHSKSSFIINDFCLFDNQEVAKKGGYNLFRAFAVEYLILMENSLKNAEITSRTLKHIKDDLFKNFLIVWYYKTKIARNQYTYDLSGIKDSMKVYYSNVSYYVMILSGFKMAFFKIFKLFFLRFIKIKGYSRINSRNIQNNQLEIL